MTGRRLAAFHEASHFVVGAALGYRPTHCTVEGDNDPRGFCGFAYSGSRKSLSAIADEITLDLAGRIGENIAAGRDWHLIDLRGVLVMEKNDWDTGPEGYRRAAEKVLLPVVDHPATAALEATYWLDEAMPKAARKAARLLVRDWSLVGAIASRLDRDGVYKPGRDRVAVGA